MNFKEIKDQIEEYLESSIPNEPESLYAPVRASIATGGKRGRPILTAIWSSLKNEEWLPAATAVELLHTFTLVHDDIMDNAELRRGEPTIHIAYGENEAILAGDVIIALALEQLARCGNSSEMLREFSIGFRGVCEGQALDKEFELRNDVTFDEYLRMIELKTSRIFELSAVLGAIVAGGENIERARLYARELGLAFQIQDDLLDLTGTPLFGKTIGGDILEGKRSALFVLAMEKYDNCSSKEKELLQIIADHQAKKEDIAAVRDLFEKLGVLKKASELAALHAERAMKHIKNIPDMELLENVLEFTREILGPALANKAVTLAGR